MTGLLLPRSLPLPVLLPLLDRFKIGPPSEGDRLDLAFAVVATLALPPALLGLLLPCAASLMSNDMLIFLFCSLKLLRADRARRVGGKVPSMLVSESDNAAVSSPSSLLREALASLFCNSWTGRDSLDESGTGDVGVSSSTVGTIFSWPTC